MKPALLLITCLVALPSAAQEHSRLPVDPERLLKRFDKNSDGLLSRDELPRPQLLRRLDRNDDRSISLDELKAFYSPQKTNPKKTDRKGSFSQAADYLESKNGHALLIYHHDRLIFEAYFNGWSASKPHRLASGTKSFSGIMAVAAEEDGLLRLDEKVSETITEWADDPRKSKITIRQLLTLTSGIYGGKVGSVPAYTDAVEQAEARFRPGAKFQYGPVPFQIFGELMRRKLRPAKRSVEQYMKERLLNPIGLQTSWWVKDPARNVRLPSGVLITAREWAKFGLFILHHGKWGDRQIVQADSVKKCLTGTRTNPNYGLTFWLGDKGTDVSDLAMAAGAGKQKLFILPSRNLLIVQFAEATRTYQESRLLELILNDLPKE